MLEEQEEERIREIVREEIEGDAQERARYLSLSVAHDFPEDENDITDLYE